MFLRADRVLILKKPEKKRESTPNLFSGFFLLSSFLIVAALGIFPTR